MIRTDILLVLGYAGTIELMLALDGGISKFTNLMFEIQMNPAVLNRLLREMIEHSLVKRIDGGYILTLKGETAFNIALQIISISMDKAWYMTY